jgi:hypothetical protein
MYVVKHLKIVDKCEKKFYLCKDLGKDKKSSGLEIGIFFVLDISRYDIRIVTKAWDLD